MTIYDFMASKETQQDIVQPLQAGPNIDLNTLNGGGNAGSQD